MSSKDDSQSPVLVLADGHENVIFLKEVNLFCPPLDTFVTMAHCVALLGRSSLTDIALVKLGRLLQLGKELGVEDVDLVFEVLGDYVVLEEAQVKEDEDVIQVNTWLEELKVFLGDFYCAIQVAVDEFAHHVVLF